MKSIDQVLLKLYEAASDTAAPAFLNRAMGLLQEVVPFDSGGRTCLDTRGAAPAVVAAALYREELVMIGEWQSVNHADPIMEAAFSQVGRSTSYHRRSLALTTADPVFRHYMSNNSHHQNGLVLINRAGSTGMFDALGFYRADPDRQFSRREMLAIDIMGPHLVQAHKVNQRLNGVADAGMSLAAFRLNGQLQFASNGFIDRVRLEWPGWNGRTLPEPLRGAVGKSGDVSYSGNEIEIDARVHGSSLFMRVRTRSPLSKLSQRELLAARLYGKGLSNKEVAREMQVTPNTARNFIQRVYQKLELSDKAALAATVGVEAPR